MNDPSSSQPLRSAPVVFVVHSDASLRESVARLLRDTGWQVRTFCSAHEFLGLEPEHRPACVILDVSLPDLNGLELQQMLAERTELPVIFIAGFADVPVIVRAMKNGAVEFLTQPVDQQQLLLAIEHALERSRAALCRGATRRILQARYATLSTREQEVMVLVVAGRLNKQVGAELGISEITVKAHRGRVMRKMAARSLPELVRIATEVCAPDGDVQSGPRRTFGVVESPQTKAPASRQSVGVLKPPLASSTLAA